LMWRSKPTTTAPTCSAVRPRHAAEHGARARLMRSAGAGSRLGFCAEGPACDGAQRL